MSRTIVPFLCVHSSTEHVKIYTRPCLLIYLFHRQFHTTISSVSGFVDIVSVKCDVIPNGNVLMYNLFSSLEPGHEWILIKWNMRSRDMFFKHMEEAEGKGGGEEEGRRGEEDNARDMFISRMLQN